MGKTVHELKMMINDLTRCALDKERVKDIIGKKAGQIMRLSKEIEMPYQPDRGMRNMFAENINVIYESSRHIWNFSGNRKILGLFPTQSTLSYSEILKQCNIMNRAIKWLEEA